MNLSSDQKLQIVLAGAKNTSDMQGTTNYEDIPLANLDPSVSRIPIPGSLDFTTNGVAAVDICAAPQVGFQRKITSILINNIDAASCTYTIQKYGVTAAAVTSKPWKWVIATLYQAVYTASGGWKMFTSAGVTQ